MSRSLEVFLRFLRLGVTAFGGPIAHLGYFGANSSSRPPGSTMKRSPRSSRSPRRCRVRQYQIGMLLGAKRAGAVGAIAAWVAFTFPSALVLAIAGCLLRSVHQGTPHGWFTYDRRIGEEIIVFFQHHPWLIDPLRAATTSLALPRMPSCC